MELTDLPRDTNASLASVRRPLVQLVNSCRRSDTKRELLKATLEAALKELSTQGASAPVEAEKPVQKPSAKPKATRRATAKVDKDAA